MFAATAALIPQSIYNTSDKVSISMVPITMAAEQHSSWNNQVSNITFGYHPKSFAPE